MTGTAFSTIPYDYSLVVLPPTDRHSHDMLGGARAGAGQNAKLTLQHFMLQSQFVSAYRTAIRSTRPLPDPSIRRETVDHFRFEIERLRFITDIDVLKTQLSAFQKTVKTLGGTFGIGGLAPETGARLIGRTSR